MCGIVGIFNREHASADLVKALSLLKDRGKDAAGACSGEESWSAKSPELLELPERKHILGHLLHSLVGFVPQPLKKGGWLSANCEIYNWEELKDRHGFSSRNDSELLLELIEKQGVGGCIRELDGVFAFAYWKGDRITIARDLLGVKPLWYSLAGGFCFASEKKALELIGCADIRELNPRTILHCSLSTGKIEEETRPFFSLEEGKREDEEGEGRDEWEAEGKEGRGSVNRKAATATTRKLLEAAVRKRVPESRFGVLFSGGLDSTLIAKLCQESKRPFSCYLAYVEDEGFPASEDAEYARKTAKEMGLVLRERKLSLSDCRRLLEKVVPLIEDSNVVKVGVALTLYAACELAKEDGVRVLFSGLGAEEGFGGYERHRHARDLNKECLSGLLKMYERDLYRDDVLTMNQNIELRLPFLDTALLRHALPLPPEMKIQGKERERNKAVLRDIAKEMGIAVAERKKKAAQYGSRTDKALDRLAKKEGFPSKSAFLRQFYVSPNVRLGVLWSGGKDSAFAAYTMLRQNYALACLISLDSSNPDSYMFHTPTINLVGLQAEAMGIPLILEKTAGEKEEELEDLRRGLKRAKEEHGIQGIVTGALFSSYQRDRIERVCDEIGLKIFAPLWHMDQEKEMRLLLEKGFHIMLTRVAAEGLDRSWLGRELKKEDVDKLSVLAKKHGMNIAGEGGETESLVLDCPLFRKRLVLKETEILEEGSSSARLIVRKAELEEKEFSDGARGQ